jgi:hypothetical protein
MNKGREKFKMLIKMWNKANSLHISFRKCNGTILRIWVPCSTFGASHSSKLAPFWIPLLACQALIPQNSLLLRPYPMGQQYLVSIPQIVGPNERRDLGLHPKGKDLEWDHLENLGPIFDSSSPHSPKMAPPFESPLVNLKALMPPNSPPCESLTIPGEHSSNCGTKWKTKPWLSLD